MLGKIKTDLRVGMFNLCVQLDQNFKELNSYCMTTSGYTKLYFTLKSTYELGPLVIFIYLPVSGLMFTIFIIVTHIHQFVVIRKECTNSSLSLSAALFYDPIHFNTRSLSCAWLDDVSKYTGARDCEAYSHFTFFMPSHSLVSTTHS